MCYRNRGGKLAVWLCCASTASPLHTCTQCGCVIALLSIAMFSHATSLVNFLIESFVLTWLDVTAILIGCLSLFAASPQQHLLWWHKCIIFFAIKIKGFLVKYLVCLFFADITCQMWSCVLADPNTIFNTSCIVFFIDNVWTLYS